MKKFTILTFLCILSVAAFPLGNYAASEMRGDELKLYLGEVQVLPVSNPTRIVIGDPSIADVVKVTKDDITISPKAEGVTSMVLWDNFGEQSYQLKVYKENINDIKRRVDNLLANLEIPSVFTKAEEEEGKIMLVGTVKTKEDLDRITLALGQLKGKTVDLVAVKEEETGVEIAVQLLELSKGATKTLGFTGPRGLVITEGGRSPGLTAGATWHNLFKILDWQRDAFTWTLEGLIQEGKARVLSRPRLLCQSGKEATLMVGGEKPVMTTSVAINAGTSTSVEYKEFGIQLKIRPTVTEDRRIKLVIGVEVSEPTEQLTLGPQSAPTALAYPMNRRSITTELYLDDNQTLAIGGLMKQKHEESTVKTAGLGDIPILGALFRKKTTSDGGGLEQGDNELFVTLTPTIVDALKRSLLEESKKKNQPLNAAARTAPSTQMPDPLRRYSAVVQRRILDNFKYPASARNAGFQGTVTLTLHLSYSGELLGAAVKSSSGYKVLDEHALAVARAIGAYPPFPPTLDQQEIWVEVPIVYSLE